MASRSDRRTFLANSARTGAAVSLAPLARAAAGVGPAGDGGAPGRPTGLLVNGDPARVGADPDDLGFSWRVTDGRRGAVQGAYRLVVTGGSRRWDSGPITSPRQSDVPYGGPPLPADADCRWTVRTADAARRWGPAAGAAFTTGLRTGDWTARWVRPGPSGVPEAYTYLRTVVHPAGRSPVARATAYVSAAHKYQLWVGGALADSGPSFSYPDEQYVQAADVTAHLAAGRPAVLGVLHKWYGPGQGRPASSPGLLVQVQVHHADGSVERFGTDGTWRQRPAEWLPGTPRNTEGDFTERIDARLAPLGWADAAYDDSAWDPVPELGPVTGAGAGPGGFSGLTVQRTRIAEHALVPVSVRTLASGSVVADFGKVYAARPRVRFAHGVAGRPVSLHVGYLLDADGQVSTTRGTQGTDLSFAYTQRHGAQEFLPFTFLGWRYLQIDGAGEPLGPAQVDALARHAAMPESSPAAFTTSDPTLDAVWDLCTRSCLYTSHEQFVDTPTREKGQFLWDASNESEAVMHAWGDRNLTRQALRDFHRSQERYWPDGLVNTVYPNGDGARSLPEFAERYAEWLWRYYAVTLDRAAAVAHQPVVAALADYVWQAVDPGTGLVTSLNGGGSDADQSFVDGPPQMLYGYDTSCPALTTTNVLSVNLFRRAAQLGAVAGAPPAQVAEASTRAATLLAALNDRLFAPGAGGPGVYVDGLRPGGAPSPHASQQANALALAYGCVPPSRVAGVGAHVAALGMRSGPPHGMELCRALHTAGLDAALARLLTDPHGPGYGHILAAGGTFTWESWTPLDVQGDSMSHGWGSSALVAMQEAFLGVTFDGAGPTEDPGTVGQATTLTVRPATGGPRQAAGTVLTPAGPLTVGWRRAGGRLALGLGVPPNARLTVHLPGRGPGDLTESGHPVGSVPGVSVTGSSGGVVTLAVGAGTYRLSAPLPA